MRIISKFKDYYDGAVGYGIDPTLMYIRKEEEIYLDNIKYKDFPNISSHRWEDEYEMIIIGFCDKIIPIIKLVEKIESKNSYQLETTRNVFFYGDNALEDMYTHQKKDSELQPKYKKYWNRTEDWGMTRDRESFAKIKELNLKELFIEHNTPIFKIEYISINHFDQKFKLTINPCLKEYNFFTQYDAYQAFQEISMFIGGVLPRQEPDTVDVSEACKVHSKGFDSWTFRKKGPNSKKKAKTKGKC